MERGTDQVQVHLVVSSFGYEFILFQDWRRTSFDSFV